MKKILYLILVIPLNFYAQNNKIKTQYEFVSELRGDNTSKPFYSVNKIQVDDKECVYLLDGNEQTINKYDQNGKFILSYGKKGKGPGEFDVCRDFQLLPSGKIIAADDYNRRITVFKNDGSVENTISFPEAIIKIGMLPGNQIIAEVLDVNMQGSDYIMNQKLSLYDSEMKLITLIDSVQYKDRKRISGYNGLVKYPYPNKIIWGILSNGNIVVTHTHATDFKVFSNKGKMLFKKDNIFVPKKLTVKDQNKYFNEGKFKQQNNSWDLGAPQIVRDKTVFPKQLPSTIGLLIDKKDNIIFKQHTYSGEPTKIIIAKINSAPLSVQLKKGILLEISTFSKEFLYDVIENIEDGIPILKKYRYEI
ncbi:MAG: 6-bladed beta-propeller [Bacteroidota bacterium]